jgi:hypothetical protein
MQYIENHSYGLLQEYESTQNVWVASTCMILRKPYIAFKQNKTKNIFVVTPFTEITLHIQVN